MYLYTRLDIPNLHIPITKFSEMINCNLLTLRCSPSKSKRKLIEILFVYKKLNAIMVSW